MIRVLTWNTMWASAAGVRGESFRSRLPEMEADVICLTEAFASLLPPGHVIESEPDYGYPIKPGRRKVILWSKRPWADVDMVGTKAMPSGRFASGVTETSVGAVRFVGVCIPWKDAHVRTGRKDRRVWEDHLTYLGELKSRLARYDRAVPTVVLGDFNQAIPRVRQRKDMAEALEDTFAGWTVCTAGAIDEGGKPVIDHVATDGVLRPESIEVASRFDGAGKKLSDHVGVMVRLRV